MVELELSQGYVALVDDDLFDDLNRWVWSASVGRTGICYAVRRRSVREAPGPYLVRLHRVVLGVDDAPGVVDHINGDGLDNRRANLRLATFSQNMANSRARPSRRFKGVYWSNSHNGWRAQIMADGRRYSYGTFDTEEAAARAYDAAAKELFGPFARLHFGD